MNFIAAQKFCYDQNVNFFKSLDIARKPIEDATLIASAEVMIIGALEDSVPKFIVPGTITQEQEARVVEAGMLGAITFPYPRYYFEYETNGHIFCQFVAQEKLVDGSTRLAFTGVDLDQTTKRPRLTAGGSISLAPLVLWSCFDDGEKVQKTAMDFEWYNMMNLHMKAKYLDNYETVGSRMASRNMIIAGVIGLKGTTTEGVIIDPQVNKSRKRMGLKPKPDYTIIRIAPDTVTSPPEALGHGTHASPSPHWRRGHTRVLRNGLVVPVRATKVKAGPDDYVPAPKYKIDDGIHK